MNFIPPFSKQIDCLLFPSPTGVNYYESKGDNIMQIMFEFPSPTGVNYYE